MRSIIAIIAMSILSVLILVGSLVEVHLRRGSKKNVAIIIVDDFRIISKHGKEVKKIASRWSMGRCRVSGLHTGLDSQSYHNSLLQVAALVNKYPGIRIILNLSIGSANPDETEKRIIQNLNNKGVLVVAAAGNNGNSIPLYPAAYDGVVAVAAAKSGMRANYSNYGPLVDLAVETKGTKSFRTEIVEIVPYVKERKITTIQAGTSNSAPKLAGMLGSAWASNPNLNKYQLLSRMKESCQPIPDVDYFKGNLGSGLLNDYQFVLKNIPYERRKLYFLCVEFAVLIFIYLSFKREWIPTIIFLFIICILLFLYFRLLQLPIVMYGAPSFISLLFWPFLGFCWLCSPSPLSGKSIYISYSADKTFHDLHLEYLESSLKDMGAICHFLCQQSRVLKGHCSIHITDKEYTLYKRSILPWRYCEQRKIRIASPDDFWMYEIVDAIRKMFT